MLIDFVDILITSVHYNIKKQALSQLYDKLSIFLLLTLVLYINPNQLSEMQSSINILQLFKAQEEVHEKLEESGLINPSLDALLDYCEYSIRIEFDKNDKKKFKDKKRKNEVKQMFRKAFDSCEREQKVRYYVRAMTYVSNFSQGKIQQPIVVSSGLLTGQGFSRSFNLKRWKKKLFKLDRTMHIFYAQLETKIKTYELGNYLLRISKNTSYKSFVLEAINQKPHQKSRTVHIGFDSIKDYETWYQAIKTSVQFKEWQFFYKLYFSSDKNLGQINSDRGIYQNRDLDGNIRPNSAIYENKPLFREDQVMRKTLYENQRKQLQEFPISKTDKIIIKQERQFQQFQSKQKQKRELSPDTIRKERLESQIRHFEEEKQILKINNKTIVDELIQGDVFEEPDVFEEKIKEEQAESIQVKKHLDLFHKILPEYELSELQSFQNYESIFNQGNIRIFKNSNQEKRVKMVIDFKKETFSKQNILSIISSPQTLIKFNENIQQMQIKTYISSQNSAIMYLVTKAYNRLYRPRDFVFIRHVFSEGSKLYMVDKSVQNTNYPPFMTIVRGDLCIVWGVIENQKQLQLIVDVVLTNEGYLNVVQELNLTLKLLKGFTRIVQAQGDDITFKLFDISWDITKNQSNKIQNQIRTRRNTIQKIQNKHRPVEDEKKQSSDIQSPQKSNQISFAKKTEKIYNQIGSPIKQNQIKLVNPKDSPSIERSLIQQSEERIRKYSSKNMEQAGELKQEQLKLKERLRTQLEVKRYLDKNGFVIISQEYAKHTYLLEPVIGTKLIYLEAIKGHPIWKGQWIHDDKEGAIIFINRKKIEDQKGVLKFILTKIGKNLIQGKSILNISLPVDIFAAESNLQRLIISMSYAPLLLDNLNGKDVLTKLKQVICFGLTNSSLYLNMQKPFNPILGETFQCWLNGCPAYAEQISHHPPIGAVLLKGRGYQISAQLQSKVELHMNSGCGTNDGIYRILFDDETQICFITPGGEVSGLTYGDRKFNIVGKSYYWIMKTNIMIEIIFDPYKKGFFSVGKKEKPIDYFQGTIYETKPQFMSNFLQGKRKEPSEKDRVLELGKISGIWNQYFKFNDEEIFNLDKLYPLKLEYEEFPLPSDANWREDIEYRRLGQTTRAQAEKERLQVFQRKDKKLRQKYHKK